jgi:hypothetical protein
MLSLHLGVAACGVAEFPPRGNVAPDSSSSGLSFVDAGFLPKDQIVVFLHIGHSNMAGRATSPPELESYNYSSDPHLWTYRGGVWSPAVEPLSPDQNTGGRAGPGMSILRSALAMAPDHYMVSIGHGQSGAIGGRCPTFRKGGLFYDDAMSRAIELKGSVTFGAIFTMFGISEDYVDADHFGDCMEGLANEMRGDLGEPELPFMVGDWETGAETENGTQSAPAAQIIIPQLRALPTRIARSAVIPTEGLPLIPADHHYDFVGHKLWAERGLDILRAKGWAPWAAQAPPPH